MSRYLLAAALVAITLPAIAAHQHNTHPQPPIITGT